VDLGWWLKVWLVSSSVRRNDAAKIPQLRRSLPTAITLEACANVKNYKLSDAQSLSGKQHKREAYL
jgi:hypothetical protein